MNLLPVTCLLSETIKKSYFILSLSETASILSSAFHDYGILLFELLGLVLNFQNALEIYALFAVTASLAPLPLVSAK